MFRAIEIDTHYHLGLLPLATQTEYSCSVLHNPEYSGFREEDHAF